MIPVFSPTLFMPKAAGGAFNPVSLVGTHGGFWRADIGTTLSGSNVTAWADQSTNGNNLGSVGGNSTPTWSATGFNTSFAGITFVRSSSQSLGINWSGGGGAGFSFNDTTMSWFCLMNLTSGFITGARPCNISISGGNDFTTPAIAFAIDTGPVLDVFSNSQIGDGGSTPPFTVSVPVVLGCTLDGTNGNTYINFATQGSATSFTSAIGSATQSQNTFGVSFPSSGNFLDGTIAYVLFTNHAMTGGDITNLKTWTNSNWGTSF